MTARIVARGLILAGASLALAAAWMAGAQPDEDPAGRSLYIRYCADCHGPSGRGDGPAAAELRPPPADLTHSTLSRSELIRVIDGRRPLKAHGFPAMPAWGDLFSSQAGASGERTIEIRVGTLADEVLWLRERSDKSEAPGPKGP